MNDRQICLLGALENAPGIDADGMVLLGKAGAVAHQAMVDDRFGLMEDGSDFAAPGEVNNLLAVL